MATATLKLFSSLSSYLPADAHEYKTAISIDPGTTVDFF